MYSRFALLALVAVLSQAALAVPVAKDLTEDIENAKLRLTFYDLEVVELINRINIMEIELGLPIEDLSRNIIQNLLLIAPIGKVDAVRDAFVSLRNEFEVNSQSLRRILAQQMRTTISRTYDNLERNLEQVPTNAQALRTETDNANADYVTMLESIEARATEADLAVTDAVNGQDGPEVVNVYADLQAIFDILENERFYTTNVKIVFDARGQDAFDALDVVIAQVPTPAPMH